MASEPFDAHGGAREIDDRLREKASAERAARDRTYHKSELTHYGVTVPVVRRIVAQFLKRSPWLTADQLWALVGELWSESVHERRLAAIVLLGRRSELLIEADMAHLERLLRECRGWALLDTLATSAVSDLVGTRPSASAALDRWAGDPDFWIRRAALLALVPALRRGAGDWDRFSRYADAMLDEREFFIRKAIGWGLRDAGRPDPDRVFAWLLPRHHRASGVTMREAIKPLTRAQRRELTADIDPPATGMQAT